jgi:hypothetical protein
LWLKRGINNLASTETVEAPGGIILDRRADGSLVRLPPSQIAKHELLFSFFLFF